MQATTLKECRMPNNMSQAFKKLFGRGWKDVEQPPNRQLEVAFKVSGGVSELWLEQLADPKQFGRLALVDGKARALISPGSYVLEFRGRTNTPKEEYDIEVTAPAGSTWKPDPKKKSDSQAIVLGIHSLEVV